MEFDFNTVLGIAFGLWAGVVGWLGHGIRQDLRNIARDMRSEAEKLNQYIVQTESRLSVLEDRVKFRVSE